MRAFACLVDSCWRQTLTKWIWILHFCVFTPGRRLCCDSYLLSQHSKFASAVSKCRGFCLGISPFYRICLGNKNVEAVKYLEIKKDFLELKKKFLVKEKNISFIKKLFYKTQIIHLHLYSLFIPSFCIFLTHYSSTLNRSFLPESLLCYALIEVIDVIHFFLSK